MKDKKKVTKLIEALKAEAENEYELRRISVLEKDLLEGMPKVEVIDENHQNFNDHIYYKDKSGHYSRCDYLHVNVWEYYNGAKPPMSDIHHKSKDEVGNFDPSKNDIEDLQLLSKTDHRKLHRPLNKYEIKTYICKNCGKEFQAINYSNHYHCSPKCREAYKRKQRVEKQCIICEKTFLASKYRPSLTCSRQCARKLAQRRKEIERQDN